MKSKSFIAIPIILIVILGLALFALWPKPSIEFRNESVLGHTITSVVLEDWTLTSAQGGENSTLTFPNGKSVQARWQIVQTVPPAHRFDRFPESFFYHTIYVAPVQTELIDYINANKPTVTYYLNGEAKQIQFK
uniref:Lipopolysaccharide export system ATP-binding protein transport, ABC-transporter, LIPID TRANSPORT n=1 Tax=Myoviridae sp. ctRbn2 TaxID=2825104 RepID=A0A8S5PWS3_9CAUD|nr:MAG TPA: Lipopolysaccharide export system ATP-binding protein transport, ABC-transporter, LIPID TRANSPORT [Myoviridae sp. ctRbn2]